jgi:hypothetical protein
MAQSSMPDPHYHVCRLALTACDFNCKRCGRLIREMARLIPAHFTYGCCHRCAAYQGCDFLDRHRKVLEGVAAAGDIRHVPVEFKDGQPVMPAAAPQQNSAFASPPA